MSQVDSNLEETLEKIKKGTPKERVLQDMLMEKGNLIPLVNLASAIRALNSPIMDQTKIDEQRKAVVAAALATTKHKSSDWHAGLTRWMTPISISAVAIFLFFGLLLVFGIFLYRNTSVNAKAVTVIEFTGRVEVSSSRKSNDWQLVSNGQKIRQGEELRTGDHGTVTIRFSNGTQMNLNSLTEVGFTNLGGSAGERLQVLLEQESGTGLYSVVPLNCKECYFKVQTPSGLVSVHGTIFNIDIVSDGTTWVGVSRGEVEVSNKGSQVLLTSGQATINSKNMEPQPPAYDFYLQGRLTSMASSIWTVAGVSITVPPMAEGKESIHTGDLVSVKGRILNNEVWMADRIQTTSQDQEVLRFNGVIQAIDNSKWVIGGKELWITTNTYLSKDLPVGSSVAVAFTVLPDDRWLATEIKNHKGDDELLPVSTSTPTSKQSTTEQIFSEGTPDISLTLTVIPSEEGNRSGCRPGDKQQPEGLKLSSQFSVSYAEIMSWFCQGFGFGEIKQAYELSLETDASVADIFIMRKTGLGWGEIKKVLSPKPTKELTKHNDIKPTHKPTQKPKK